MFGVASLLAFVAVVLFLPTISDLISLLYAATRRPTRRPAESTELPRLLFLVPAHNEELLIRNCLRSLRSLRYPTERYSILVVADNCTDQTADIARSLPNIVCLERDDRSRLGKPHAIAWSLERAPIDEFDAVVIIDADSEVDPDFGIALARVAPLRMKALQAYNGVSNPGENSLTRMADVLSAAYYRFMYPLKQRAGLNAPLTGSGMCIGTSVLARHGWTAFSVGEDTEMYVRLTLAGVPTEVVPDARVSSQEAASLSSSRSQRVRWRAGRLSILTRVASTLLSARGVSLRQRFDLLAELTAPGPAVHLGTVIILSLAGLVLPPTVRFWILAVSWASLLRPIAYTVLALSIDRQPGLALRAFLYLPPYCVWRLATEVTALAVFRTVPWVRTRRHP